MKLMQLGYKDAAEKAGFEFFPGNTNGDAAKEAEFLNTYVTQGYKGVAISPISEGASMKVIARRSRQRTLRGNLELHPHQRSLHDRRVHFR